MSVLDLREGCGSKSASVSMKNRFLLLSLRVVETRPAEECGTERAKACAGAGVQCRLCSRRHCYFLGPFKLRPVSPAAKCSSRGTLASNQ